MPDQPASPPAQPADVSLYTLAPAAQQKLDGIIQQMQANGESDDYIRNVVSDFKQKYGAPPGPVQRALNYRTGNQWIDAPLGVLEGVGKGAASTLYGTLDLANQVVPHPIELNPEYRASVTQTNGIGQSIGKFAEQTGEFLLPDALAGKAVEGLPLLARLAAKGATDAGVAGIQSGGNPTAMIVGGALGAGGELAGSGIRAVRELGKTKAPTLPNYWDAFAATPGQRPEIGDAVPVLTRDGIMPGNSPGEMLEAVQNRLAALKAQYQALDPAIASRSIDADVVIRDLQAQQAAYMKGVEEQMRQVPTGLVDPRGQPILHTQVTSQPLVSPANEKYFRQLNDEIEFVRRLAAQNDGQLTFDQLRYLRDGANGKTSFSDPPEDRNLFRGIGNAYRRAMDFIAPETTPLNRDYATYKNLLEIAQENVNKGRGLVPSGLEQASEKAASRQTGLVLGGAIGEAAGHATGIPGAGWVGAGLGGAVGAAVWPKLSAPVVQTLKNAAENGALEHMAPAKLKLLQWAASVGDNQTILSLLGQAAGKAKATEIASQ